MALSKAVIAATWNAPRYNGLTSARRLPHIPPSPAWSLVLRQLGRGTLRVHFRLNEWTSHQVETEAQRVGKSAPS